MSCVQLTLSVNNANVQLQVLIDDQQCSDLIMTLIKDVTVIQTLRFLMSSAQLEKSVDNASV